MNAVDFQRAWRGGVARSALWDAGDWSRWRDRSSWRIETKDTWRHIDSYTFARIVSDSQRLFANLGIVKGAALEKADYAFGTAWQPRFLGANRKWGERAGAMLADWHRSCNVLGYPFGWNKGLALASLCMDRDGRSFAYTFRTDSGYPLVQFVPGHRIASRRSGEIKDGKYRGFISTNGVIMTGYGRPVAYEMPATRKDEDRVIGRDRMMQVFDPEWWDGGTGLPAITHAVLDLHDLKDTQDFEKLAIKAASAISLLEYNEAGNAPDPEEEGSPVVTSKAADGGMVHYETMLGGLVRYFRSNSGSKLESFISSRPPETWHRFVEYILRCCFAGLRWPIEIAWDASKIGGATVRLVRNKAVAAVRCRQDLLAPLALRLDAFAVGCFIDAGWLEFDAEWYKWGHTRPAEITVDEGRDAQNFERLYRIGAKNLSDWLGPAGKGLEDHLRERAREAKLKEQIAVEEGVDASVFTAPVNGGAAAEPVGDDKPAKGEEDEDDSGK